MVTRITAWAAVVAAALVGYTAPASAMTINVNAPVDGNPTTIGSINAQLSLVGAGGFAETGVFTFNNPWGALNDCYQFQWVQLVTADPNPPTWGTPAKPAVVPYIDPVSGGYTYQKANGGADTDPFYENTDPGNYAYPNYSARHVQGVSSSTDDAPGLVNGETVNFTTYLVAFGDDLGANIFDVLAGYDWSVSKGSDGLRSTSLGSHTTITLGDLGQIYTAMGNSGFSSWEAETGVSLTSCPEPGSALVLSAGGLVLVLRRARRGRAAMR